MGGFPFNVRVYVVLYFSDRKHVLIADELIKGRRIIKFPGGGLEFGEGPVHHRFFYSIGIQFQRPGD
jgi:hypothetical protein